MHMMTQRAFSLLATGLACALLSGCDTGGPADTDPNAQTLRLIETWVDGRYHNLAQAEADMAADLPPELVHRPMHQLFARVSAPQLEGYILYQQSSLDGTENPAMIFRHGLMQYLIDPETNSVRQRELYFKDPEPFKNAHQNPEILADVTLEEMTWDPGCDFYLTTNPAGDMVSGPLLEGQCVQFNQGLQKKMYADDLVEITVDEYRFKGRYVDEAGNTLWGTESPELNTLIKQ